MTKKDKKALDKLKRVWYPINTGTRIHKDAKYPNRNKRKAELRKEVW